MRPLTDTVPKVLLEVRGKPLIVRLIEALARSGIREIVINHAHLGHMIEAALGDGGRFGVAIRYSREAEALEPRGNRTGASLLGDRPFLAVNGDSSATSTSPLSPGPRWNKISRTWCWSRIRRITCKETSR